MKPIKSEFSPQLVSSQDVVLAIHGSASSGRQWQDLTPHQQERLLRDHPGLCRDMTEITSGHWAIPLYAYCGPVTIFRGQLSPRVTADMAQHIARIHPRVSVISLQSMGHFAPLVQADALPQTQNVPALQSKETSHVT